MLIALNEVFRLLALPKSDATQRINGSIPFVLTKDEPTQMHVSFYASGIRYDYDVEFNDKYIDMDTKDVEPERFQYQRIKAKYAKPINQPKKGIYCNVEFFETCRCTELFFLYYFRYTSRPYESQEPLLKDLNRCVEYRKTIDFFTKSKGLHSYFEQNGGSRCHQCQSLYGREANEW